MLLCPSCSYSLVEIRHLNYALSDRKWITSKIILSRLNQIVTYRCQNEQCSKFPLRFCCDKSCQSHMKRLLHNNGVFTTKRYFIRHLKKYHQPDPFYPVQHLTQGIDTHSLSLNDMNRTEEFEHNNDDDDSEDALVLDSDNNQDEPLEDNGYYDTFSNADISDLGDDTHSIDDSIQISRASFKSSQLNDFMTSVSQYGYVATAYKIILQASTQNEVDINRMTMLQSSGFPPEFGSLFINISHLVLSHGEKENEIFSQLLSDFSNIIEKLQKQIPIDNSNINLGSYFKLLPTSEKEFSSKINRPSNKNSLHRLLPIPSIKHNPNTEHAMCSPTEIIQMCMILPPVDKETEKENDRYQSLILSKSFLDIKKKIPSEYINTNDQLKRPSILVYIILWSDGWDPNRSNKGNRSPIWSATGTFVYIELGVVDRVYQVYTQLLCTGPGNQSHKEFYRLLRDEKQTLWEDDNGNLTPLRFHSRFHNDDVNVFISFGFILQDNPERRGSTELRQGNSKNHGIFGYSCHFDKLDIPFYCCTKCYKNLLPYILEENYEYDCTDNSCNDCFGFSVEKLCLKGRYSCIEHPQSLKLAPNEFGYELLVKPCKLSFGMLKEGWSFAIHKYIDVMEWGIGNVKAYLVLFCICDQTIDEFVTQGKVYINIRESLNPESRAIRNNATREKWIQRYNTDPSIYTKPQYPAIWDLVEMDRITETPMHLCMGVQKATMKSVLLYCSGRNKATEYVRRCHGILDQLKKMHLDIAPIVLFKDEKFGGYVAENYNALTMISPWLSQVLTEPRLLPGPPDVVPNPRQKPVPDWSGKECKAWLKERGQRHSMPAADACTLVIQLYRNKRHVPLPPIVPNLTRELNPESIRFLLKTGHSMFCSLMAKDCIGLKGKHRAIALIALFLTNYELIDKKIIPNRESSIWIGKYNFLGLFRVPEHFTIFRLLRNLYEGGNIGEGLVKEMRVLCPKGVRDNWSFNMISKFYRKQSMKWMEKEVRYVKVNLENSILANADQPSQYILRKFKRYKSKQEVKYFAEFARPLSVITCYNQQNRKHNIFCVIKKDKFLWELLSVEFKADNCVRDTHGFTYFDICFVENGLLIPHMNYPSTKTDIFQSFGLLLPDLWTPKVDNHPFFRYSLVNENWQYMTSLNSLESNF